MKCPQCGSDACCQAMGKVWQQDQIERLKERLADAEAALTKYADDSKWDEIMDCDGVGYETKGILYINGPRIAKSYFEKWGEVGDGTMAI